MIYYNLLCNILDSRLEKLSCRIIGSMVPSSWEDEIDYRSSFGVIALAAALSRAIAAAQAHDESKYPDWAGQWRPVPDGGPPRYDPSKPPGRGQQAPLKPEYRVVHGL